MPNPDTRWSVMRHGHGTILSRPPRHFGVLSQPFCIFHMYQVGLFAYQMVL